MDATLSLWHTVTHGGRGLREQQLPLLTKKTFKKKGKKGVLLGTNGHLSYLPPPPTISKVSTFKIYELLVSFMRVYLQKRKT